MTKATRKPSVSSATRAGPPAAVFAAGWRRLHLTSDQRIARGRAARSRASRSSHAGGADVERLRVPGATPYARICGATLARAHARWSDRIAIAAYLGKGDAVDRAIADPSAAYADQNERDYDAFEAAVKAGRLETQTGL